MKYNTFIFDLDGTLLDTLQDLANSVNYALSQHGMPTHSIDDVRRIRRSTPLSPPSASTICSTRSTPHVPTTAFPN